MEGKIISIPGRLVSDQGGTDPATHLIVTGADSVFDDDYSYEESGHQITGAKQSDINAQIKQRVDDFGETIRIIDAQGNSITNSSTDVLNQTAGLIPDCVAVGGAIGQNFEDNLSSTSTAKGLTANMGRVLNERKADINGYYETMGSGTADNLAGTVSTSVEYIWHKSNESLEFGEGAASITKMKGKTLVWNQLLNPKESTTIASDITVSFSNGVLTINGTSDLGGGGRTITLLKNTFSLVSGHKYYFVAPNVGMWFIENSSEVSNYDAIGSGGKKIFTSTKNFESAFIGWNSSPVTSYNSTDRFQFIDLTLMFGAGNEPTTVAEFEAFYPLDYYAYTATPVLINNTASAIETTGFNQWDEEWDLGAINSSTGELLATPLRLRSKNFIPILPNTDYYFKTSNNLICVWYDENKSHIKDAYNYDYFNGANNVNHSPSNAAYCKFYVYKDITTYNHDICINLSGDRNGEYEPYKSPQTLYFNGPDGSLATLTGRKIVNGEPTGATVTIFPEGMKSAGSVYDFGKVDSDGMIRKVTKVLGVVDMGSLTYIYQEHIFGGTNAKSGFISNSLSGYKPAVNDNSKANAITPKYAQNTANELFYGADKGISLKSSGYIYIADSTAGTDAAAFKVAMNGVPLYYELATPEEYLLDTPVPATYYVHPDGTEKRIPEDTASVVAAPISYEVQYPIDAVRTIQNLDDHYVNATVEQSFDSTAKAQARNNIGAQAQLVVSAPASASSTGTEGTIAFDSSYIYVCVATNTWKRTALETWS